MTEYLPLLFILFLGSIIAIGAILVGKILGYQSKNTKNKFLGDDAKEERFTLD